MKLPVSFLLSLAAAFTSAALAEPAFVQSGEHPGFSRLVTTLPEGTEWSVRHVGSDVTLEFRGFRDGFETARVFDYIPRDRIAALRQTAETLELSLECDCRVSAFLDQGRFVVLDIADPQTPLSTPIIRNETGSADFDQTAAPSPETRQTQSAPFPNGPLMRERLSPAEKKALTEMQQQLTRELSRAATRGMLAPSVPLRLSHTSPTHSGQNSLPVSEENPVSLLPDPRQPAANMRISSSMDAPAGSAATPARSSVEGAGCIADSVVDLASWRDERPFHLQLGSARQAVYGEFDAVDREAALALARLYLSFGFGAEAVQALSLAEPLTEEDRTLLEVAEILEAGRATNGKALRKMLACKGDISLWALLAKETLDTGIDLAPASALRALDKLPQDLRQLVAPQVAKRLREYGDIENAQIAMRNLTRATETLTPAAKLAQAQLSLAQNNSTDAASQLESVAQVNAHESPEALVALIDVKLEQGQPIEPETAQLIAAYAKEYDGTPIGQELRQAQVLALAKSGQFDEAFSMEFALVDDPTTPADRKTRRILLSELTKNAEDIVFLDHALQIAASDLQQLDQIEQLSLAQRLTELGFPELSQHLVAIVSDRPRNEQRQLLAARNALALQQPFKAKAELIGLDNADANRLRAKASEMSGTYDLAYAEDPTYDSPEAEARSAWLAEDWQNEALAANPVFGPVAQLTASPRDTASGLDGMLARSGTALEDSVRARSALTALLAAPELQSEAAANEQ